MGTQDQVLDTFDKIDNHSRWLQQEEFIVGTEGNDAEVIARGGLDGMRVEHAR